MKARFLALAALVLGLASCQTDVVDGVKVDANGEAPVTLQVGLPQDAATRANSAVGAIDNGVNLDSEYDIRYILGVYDEKGNLAKKMVQSEDTSYQTTFNLRLVPGRHYRFVVWADFVASDTLSDLHYNTAEFPIVSLKDGEPQNLNDESRDAYTGVFNTKTDGNGKVFSSTSSVNITLKRPFAKLRVIATDMNQLYSDLKSVKVDYTSNIYTSFDALNSEVVENSMSDLSPKTVTYPEKYNGYVYGAPANGEMTLFADYIFGGEDDRVMFTLDVTDATNLPIPQVVFNTNIPVQRNYLTTIKGNVLTDANNITVEIKDAFEGEYTNGSNVDTTESFSEALKAAEESVEATIDLTGDVVWSTGAGHGSTPWIPEGAKTQKLTVNANGHKITATGSGVGAIRMANGGTLVINNATIEDKSVSYNEGAWELGYLEFGGKLEFNECEFVNAIQLEEQANATFNKCSFNSNKTKEYAVWVCGNKAYFNKCTIEGPRGIKMHEAYGSEVEEVVIDNCKFNYISEKPGVAMGDLNAETKVEIKNSTFTNCQAGDQGLYIYETDTDVTAFDFTEENNTIVYATDSNDAFNEAIVGGMSYISLGDGEFNAPAGLSNGQADNTLTIVGNGIDNTTVNGATNTNNMHPGNYAHGLDLVFENLTYVTPNNGYMGGFGHANSVTFRNCKIVGQFYAHSGAPHYFYDCIIDPLTGYLYTYASDCVFEGCTFSASEGKALQIYEDSATGENTVTIEDCAFVAAKQATTWDGKPVTGIDINSNGAKFEVYINNCTTTGFPTGLNSNSDLWNVKDAGKAHVNVCIDGAQVWFAGYDVVANGLFKKDSAYVVMNAEGLAALNAMMVNQTAGKAVKVTLGADIDFAGKTWTPVNSHVDTPFYFSELDGNGKTISNFTINGQAMFTRFAGSGNVTIKNVTFDNAQVNSNGNINTSILTVHTYQNVLLDNVDVKNSTIIGGYKVAPLIATVYNEGASTITATLKNCDVENTVVKATSYDFGTAGMVAFVYEGDNDRIVFENCSVKDVQLYAPNAYTAHAAIYTAGSETLYNEAEGVVVENVTFENI